MKIKNSFFVILFMLIPFLVCAAQDNQENAAGKNSTNEKQEKNTENRQSQELFEESLRRMMPLSKEQIDEYRKHADKRSKALAPVPPQLRSRTVQVSLEPGHAPVQIKTTANIASAIVFHDSTGSPWPISSVTNGGPSLFQVMRPEIEGKNLLNVMPLQNYGASTLIVTFDGKDIPLVVSLSADSIKAPARVADGLVLVRIKSHGPNAQIPIIKHVKDTVTTEMLSFLDMVPPSAAKRIKISPDDNIIVWKFNNLYYVRTNYDLMFPAWTSVVHGAAQTKCYEVASLPSLMVSKNGQLRSIKIEGEKK